MAYNTTVSTISLNRRLRRVFCLDDFEVQAKQHLPKAIFGYVSGATETDTAAARNRRAFAQYDLMPRVLKDVSHRTAQTELWGQKYSAPIGIAPMGSCALYAYRGDLALAQAARENAIPMILSGSSLIDLETVIEENPQTWFQAYLPGDQGQIDLLIERVKQANYQVLVVTVDTCVGANRENNARAGFSTPLKPSLKLAIDGLMHPHWTTMTFLRTIIKHGMPHFENNFAGRGAPIFSRHVERDFSFRDHLDWTHIERIRQNWAGKLVIKGILHPEDATKAVSIGADGIIVSNHGGRQLDYAIAPLNALEAIVQSCPNTPIMLDSGVRRGTDAIKAIALGAKMVFIGRPFAFAASIGGADGARHAADLMGNEIQRNMALLGVNEIAEISKQQHLIMSASR